MDEYTKVLQELSYRVLGEDGISSLEKEDLLRMKHEIEILSGDLQTALVVLNKILLFCEE